MTLFSKRTSNFRSFFKTFLHLFQFILNKAIRHKLSFRMPQYSIILLETVNSWKFRSNKGLLRDTSIAKGVSKRGFTLFELIITVCILAIITTIAAPSIQTQLANMEAKRIGKQIENSLSLAKAESYIRKEDVIVCLSNAEGRCDRDSDKTLLIFIDKDGNKNFDAQVDVLINQRSMNPKYGKLSLRVGNKRHYTKFWGDSGTPRGHFGHIKYCPTVTYNKAMYLISFSQTGKVKKKLNENHPTDCDT